MIERQEWRGSDAGDGRKRREVSATMIGKRKGLCQKQVGEGQETAEWRSAQEFSLTG
jgi:hypothetical protein